MLRRATLTARAAARPTFQQFTGLADSHSLVPVTVSVDARGVDLVTAFRRISNDGRGFVLEGKSHEDGEARYAYVGAADDGKMLLIEPGVDAPLSLLRSELAGLDVPQIPEAPEFVSGAVGFVGYEAIEKFEPSVGPLPKDPAGFPLAAFFLPEAFLAFDKENGSITAIALVDTNEGSLASAYARGHLRCEELLEKAFSVDIEKPETTANRADSPERRTSQSHYERMVREARDEIERGELLQVVLSQRVVRQTNASPLRIYKELRALNPSTYMFMLNFGEFSLVGASPELMLRSRNGVAAIHPIAGTRPRGSTPEQDASLEAELLVNEKERAEHVMLVDLARNDLGRVSKPGTVNVDSFMATERYSHVMHLVSRVIGKLRDDLDGLDAFVAGFPIGTLSGAPRLRAVELIAELEREGRGPYCGGVGWFGANGDVDTGTIIRSIAIKDGVAHVQGGGGIVYDSDPESEYLESLHKIEAQLRAIDLAERDEKSRQAEADSTAVSHRW